MPSFSGFLNHSAMQKHLLHLATLLLLALTACHKDDTPQDCPPGLPCATQTGENTFGCYINGEPWVAKVEPDVWAPTAHAIAATYDETSYLSYNNNFVSISGSYYGDDFSYVSLAFYPLTSTGSVIIDSLGLYRFEYRAPDVLYKIDTMSNYNIEIIKLDTINKILSGKFKFGAKSSAGEAIEITDGRFDVKYNPE